MDTRNLLHQLEEKEYDPSTWRPFIDTTKRSLRPFLLRNSNVLASIPLAHSTKLSESYETLKLVLEKIKYHKHEWQICSDLKVNGLLLGQQRGYTKFPFPMRVG
jgi:predicted  nucleic acid-binding Zn ribbon protein